MRKTFILFILTICLSKVWAAELSNFERSLERITFQAVNHQNSHLKIYEHTLNLGAYSLDYLWNRSAGSGLFLQVIKDSWEVYLEESRPLVQSLRKAKSSTASPLESLKALQLIERTQSLYDTYMTNKKLRYITLDQSNILNNAIIAHFEEVLSNDVNKSIVKIAKVAKKLSPEETSTSIILNKISMKEDISNFATTKTNPRDLITNISSSISTGISSGFGALAGPIEWGDGGELRDDQLVKNKVLKKLEPLDIIFEKKSYKLTDYSIPGYWGHNAVWLGTKKQLIEMGIWYSSELDPFRSQIENGNSIFEVRKWGTVFASFEKWMDLDDFAQIRVKGISSRSYKEVLKIYKILSEQIGKSYDFSFDADTAFKVTCSEIIYLSYGDVRWPITRILGRETITPNAMAEAVFYDNSPLEYIIFVKGNREKGATFYTKEQFGDLMNFTKLKNGSYVQRYRECDLEHSRTRRRGIQLRNKCLNKTRSLSL